MATASHPYSPAQILWPATPRGVHQARHSLDRQLTRWDMEDLVPEAGLVLTELMTNALRHAAVVGRKTGVSILRVPGGVRIEVHDARGRREGVPVVRKAAPEAESGRGMTVVDRVTGQRWGVTDRVGPGKVVWAECVRPGA